MRITQLFGETLREAPAEATAISHQLLVRAGYIRQLAPGAFALTPLGKRALDRLSDRLRQLLALAGGQELLLSTLLPDVFAENAACFRGMAAGEGRWLAAAGEAIAAALCVTDARSYRQLPKLLFHCRPVIRAEQRSFGGLLRTREFSLCEAFSLDSSAQNTEKQYLTQLDILKTLFETIALPVKLVDSDADIFGGKQAHEFVFLSPIGDDEALFCDGCGYAAKADIAAFRKETFADGPPQPLEKVHTPATASIAALSEFLDIDARQTAKMVFYTGNFGAKQPERLLVCVVRGDMDASEALVRQHSGAHSLRPATDAEIAAAGCVAGFASAIGIKNEKTVVIVDDLVAKSANLVTGANEPDYHLLNSNYDRDYSADVVAPVALPPDDANCAHCGKPLRRETCFSVASLRDLGTFFSEAAGALFFDENGKPQPVHLARFAVGITRMLACLAETHHDDFGLTLPPAVAPFNIALLQLKGEEAAVVAEKLYVDLQSAGYSVLFDDRNASPGVKFNDADLRGMPLRITVSDRALAQGGVEVKLRTAKDREIVPLPYLMNFIRGVLK